MSGLDCLLLCLVGIFLLFGIVQGFVRLVLSWAFLTGGFVAASFFYTDAAHLFDTWIKNEAVRNGVAFILIVIILLVAGSVFIAIFLKFLKIVRLRWLDRIAGGVVGAALGIIVSVLLIFLIVASLPAGETLIKDSLLAPFLIEIGDFASYVMPPEIVSSYERGKEYLKKEKIEKYSSDAEE